MNSLIQVFLLSMTPIGELRLAIPMGIAFYRLNAVSVFFVSIIGNFTVAAFLVVFLEKISEYLSEKSQIFQKLFHYWKNSAREKHSAKIQKYGMIGLALFVAIPLPMTGAWTGALLATLMSLPLKKSLPAILLGVIGAGLTVTALVVAGINVEKYLGWQALAGVAIFAGLIYIYFRKNKR